MKTFKSSTPFSSAAPAHPPTLPLPHSHLPQLELLDDVGDFLKAVHVRVGCVGGVGDDQEGGFFEEHHLKWRKEGGREGGRKSQW